MLDSLGAEPDVAYVAVLDAQARRRSSSAASRDALAGSADPAARDRAPATATRGRRDRRTIGAATTSSWSRRYARAACATRRRAGAGARPTATRRSATCGSACRSTPQRRAVPRAGRSARSTVVALLSLVAIVATLLLTRRLVAPMRRLMRAARAVGAGRLDVYVPAQLVATSSAC